MGIWTAVYNTENRPVSFTNNENNTVVECDYDSMGRRSFMKVTVNGSLTLHQHYIYRHVQFGGCFSFAMFSPFHTFGYQLNRRRINCPHRTFQAFRQAKISSRNILQKRWLFTLKVC